MTRVPSINVDPARPGATRRNGRVVWFGKSTRVGSLRGCVGLLATDGNERPTLELKQDAPHNLPDLRCPEIMAIGALAEVEIIAEDEQTMVKGNAGDEKSERWVLDQLERGNLWAWCSVKVKATFGAFVGESEWLGCCSYNSEDDFRRGGGYFDDMRREALDALLADIKNGVRREEVAKLVRTPGK